MKKDFVDIGNEEWPMCRSGKAWHLFDTDTDAACAAISCLICDEEFVVIPVAALERVRDEA